MSSARTDLCGGRSAMIVPTATRNSFTFRPYTLPDGRCARISLADLVN